MGNPVHKLDRELRNWAQVRDMLSGEDLDEQEILDAMEGETDLQECILDIDASILEDEIQLAGLAEIIGTLSDRKARIAKAKETKRALILMTMERTEVKTIKGAAATLTVRGTARNVVIGDESEIPANYWTPQDPKLDKNAVKDALERDEIVPGASLDNGGVSLTVRRK